MSTSGGGCTETCFFPQWIGGYTVRGMSAGNRAVSYTVDEWVEVDLSTIKFSCGRNMQVVQQASSVPSCWWSSLSLSLCDNHASGTSLFVIHVG